MKRREEGDKNPAGGISQISNAVMVVKRNYDILNSAVKSGKLSGDELVLRMDGFGPAMDKLVKISDNCYGMNS